MPRKVVTRGEILVLVIIGIIILMFTLQRMGVDVAKTTEESEIIDRPHY